jgi:hypothetical protein
MLAAVPPLTLMQFPDPPTPIQPVQELRMSISDIFRHLVRRFEDRRGNAISVMAIASEYDLQHRRVYEFFNLLSALGVCSTLERGRLSWIGLSEVPRTIETIYTEIEVGSLHNDIDALFALGVSPSLGLIALRFVSLYLYLGVDILSMRRVALLFHGSKIGIKSLERRMYVVLNFLEVIGIVEHSQSVSEYRLTLERAPIVENAMKRRKEVEVEQSPDMVEALLSRYSQQFIASLHEERFGPFARLTKDAE